MKSTLDMFADAEPARGDEILAPGAVLLHGFALAHVPALGEALQNIIERAPFRHMLTPGGKQMSVALTNSGGLGWVSDRSGYRYAAQDPQTQLPWPAMPRIFSELAANAAAQAGYDTFSPDACLVNRYSPGARLSLHQDKNEQDFRAPIVSVSLGVPATFLFGGDRRADRPQRVRLVHGDVAVWGGPARMRFHGIAPLKNDYHAFAGEARINLTLRLAG